MNQTCTRLGTNIYTEYMISHSHWFLPCYGIPEEKFHCPAEILEILHKTVPHRFTMLSYFLASRIYWPGNRGKLKQYLHIQFIIILHKYLIPLISLTRFLNRDFPNYEPW